MTIISRRLTKLPGLYYLDAATGEDVVKLVEQKELPCLFQGRPRVGHARLCVESYHGSHLRLTEENLTCAIPFLGRFNGLMHEATDSYQAVPWWLRAW